VQLDWPQWLIIILTFVMTRNKTAMASYHLSFHNSLPDPILAPTFYLNYIRTMLVEQESPPLARLPSA
jgi:hypothetical protein